MHLAASTLHRTCRRAIRNIKICRASFLALPFLLWATAGTAGAASLEAYAALPSIDQVRVSPEGSCLAFVRAASDGQSIIIAFPSDQRVLAKLRVNDSKLRDIQWADEQRLLIITSATAVPMGLVGPRHERYLLQVYDLRNGKSKAWPDASREEGRAI